MINLYKYIDNIDSFNIFFSTHQGSPIPYPFLLSTDLMFYFQTT